MYSQSNAAIKCVCSSSIVYIFKLYEYVQWGCPRKQDGMCPRSNMVIWAVEVVAIVVVVAMASNGSSSNNLQLSV
jgi:hypothetical protein